MLKNLQEIMSGGAEHALHRLWSDQLSEAEAAAIHNRVQGDPKYRDELDGLLAVFDSIARLEGDSEIQEIALEYRRLFQKRRSKQRLALGIAAGVLVAFGAVLAYFSPWSGSDDGRLQMYFTRIGEQQTIELDDGSVVTLNTASQLVVDYSEAARRIVLERGEAYFEVADDLERSFTVELGLRSVTAVGTAFNIRKDPERYQVAVIEGAVALHESTDEVSSSSPPISVDSQAAVIYHGGQHRVEEGSVVEFDLRRNRLTAYRPDSMERYQGWRSGLLKFYREPLYQVVQELNRYSRRKILIEDASVMELSVYAALSVHDLDTALIGLERLLPIEITRHYDRIVITGSDDRAPAQTGGSGLFKREP